MSYIWLPFTLFCFHSTNCSFQERLESTLECHCLAFYWHRDISRCWSWFTRNTVVRLCQIKIWLLLITFANLLKLRYGVTVGHFYSRPNTVGYKIKCRRVTASTEAWLITAELSYWAHPGCRENLIFSLLLFVNGTLYHLYLQNVGTYLLY